MNPWGGSAFVSEVKTGGCRVRYGNTGCRRTKSSTSRGSNNGENSTSRSSSNSGRQGNRVHPACSRCLRGRLPGTASRVVAMAVTLACFHVARTGWIDPDTAEENWATTSLYDGSDYELIMSDEFELDGRTFADGHDPMWTSATHSDDAQTSSGLGSQHFYNASYGTTSKGAGCMNITTTDEKTEWRGYNPFTRKYETLSKNFRSSMINSWNKFCFTGESVGGIVEISAKLPGEHNIGGLWPAFWLLGNLGRATYEASTNLIWPWSYNKCDPKLQRAQEISACNKVNHFGLHPHQGRGSTEIDILEAQPGLSSDPLLNLGKVNNPYVSTTVQLAPGIPRHRPANGDLLTPADNWYKNMTIGNDSILNYHFYGMHVDKTAPEEPVYRGADQAYLADAISALTPLKRTHFHDFHNYKLEWVPGPGGYLRWYIDNVEVLAVDAKVIEEHGTQIPDEPSYIILNTAVSSSWGFPVPPIPCDNPCYDCGDDKCHCAIPQGFCKMLPSYFMIDYVRVYQNTSDDRMSVGCDIPSHPSKLWIQAHQYRYMRVGDKKPLKAITAGWGKCEEDEDCFQGSCHWGRCHCEKGWVGPKCQVTDKFDDVTYEHHVSAGGDTPVDPAVAKFSGVP
ncbi:unnamed protein product [Ascophyllum nodosum]